MAKIFPIIKKIVVQEIIGDATRDVSYEESFTVSEQLAGTLGPVFTQDSVDAGDSLAVESFSLAESFNCSERIAETSTLDNFDDTLSVSEQLAGTLGPVFTQDSIDTSDALVADNLFLKDTLSSGDLIVGTSISSIELDSFNTQDSVNEIKTYLEESSDMSDELALGPTTFAETYSTLEIFGNTDIKLEDSLQSLDQPVFNLVVDNTDSVDIFESDLFSSVFYNLNLSENSVRGLADFSGVMWADAVVASSNFDSTANAIDTDPNTASVITVSDSGGLFSSSQTKSGDITVSLPDSNINPTPTFVSATIEAGWTTTESSALISGNSVNATIEYSLDDGLNYTLLATITDPASSGDPTASVTMDYTKFQQIRFRVTASVTSGTVLLGTATQTFEFRYGRLSFNGQQSL